VLIGEPGVGKTDRRSLALRIVTATCRNPEGQAAAGLDLAP